jgi:hypothetical protein
VRQEGAPIQEPIPHAQAGVIPRPKKRFSASLQNRIALLHLQAILARNRSIVLSAIARALLDQNRAFSALKKSGTKAMMAFGIALKRKWVVPNLDSRAPGVTSLGRQKAEGRVLQGSWQDPTSSIITVLMICCQSHKENIV